jgi:hypothetical protein
LTVGGAIQAGPAAKFLRSHGFSVARAAEQIDLHEDSLRRFLTNESLARYCGKQKQERLRILLKLSPQQFGKAVKRVRAENAALKVANGGEQ